FSVPDLVVAEHTPPQVIELHDTHGFEIDVPKPQAPDRNDARLCLVPVVQGNDLPALEIQAIDRRALQALEQIDDGHAGCPLSRPGLTRQDSVFISDDDPPEPSQRAATSISAHTTLGCDMPGQLPTVPA